MSRHPQVDLLDGHPMPLVGTWGAAARLIGASADRTTRLTGFAALLLVGTGAALAAGSPLALKHLVDTVADPELSAPSDHQQVGIAAATYVAMLVGARVTADLRPLLANRIEQRVLASLRQRFFAHLLCLPMAYLVRRRGSELLHSVELAAAATQVLISHVINSLVPVSIELVLMAVILAELQQPHLVLVFGGSTVLYVIVFTVGVSRQKPAIESLTAASMRVQAHLSDGVHHAETMRCFGAEAQSKTSLAQAIAHLMARWMHFSRLNVEIGLAASMIFALTLTLCLSISTEAVARGHMTVGGFVLSSVYMLQMVRPLEALGNAARDLSRARGFLRPLLDLLEAPCETQAPSEDASPCSPLDESSIGNAPSLRLEDVHFGYDPDRPILHGLNLEIPGGKTTAIVGRSGCGKSSIIRLLLRLYSPQKGRILLDGHPMAALPAKQLRALFGAVPQDAALLQATVRENIALGLPGASTEDIEQAAAQAGIHRHIGALPQGYDTPLGDRGQTFSGGERQRLAIARAILRKPKIYVLDEPTSMLDSKTEAAVQHAMRKLTAGCTTVVIAHRLSTVMHADEIVVLDDGQVQERGSHDELLAQDGIYAQLWRQQTQGAP